MESFENFNDTSSQYGVPDDTASMVSGYTTTTTVKTQEETLDLTSLSLADNVNTREQDPKFSVDEDFDGVLEDLKDNNAVDLPPHACRCGLSLYFPISISLIHLVIVEFTRRRRWSNV